MRDRIFYAACFGFIFGVLLRSFIFVDFYTIILFLILILALFIFFVFISKNKWGVLISIFILVFTFGVLRLHFSLSPAPSIFEAQVREKVSLTGIVLDEPDVREDNQKLTVKTELEKQKTKILITTSRDMDFKYGDEINFEGILKKPDNFTTDQSKEFDYINYLRKDGIFYIESYPSVEIVSHRNGNFIKSILFDVKEKFVSKMNLVIREPESLLMGGLILGEKSSFSEALRQSFVDTGTIHIVALSGYNVTIVAEWIMKFFSLGHNLTGETFFPQNIGIGAGIISILLFVLMTGGSSTAIRAGVMASLALFARLIGRNYDVSRALIIAGVIMILINPFVLAFDVSFELSFIATVAVIFFTPKIEKYFLWVTFRLGLRDIVSVTTAAYIFVLPFIIYKMGNLSLVALPANILILPLIPITMIFGFLTGFTGVIWYFLSIPFGYVSYLLLHYELAVVSFFSNVPFAALPIPNFPLIITILIYAYFVYMLFGRSIKSFFCKN